MADLADQIPMQLPCKPVEVDLDLIRRQPSLTAAIRLCVSLGGFARDKQLYMPLGFDKGHWSRILKGDAHFPPDKLGALQDLCRNNVPFIWQAFDRGFDPASLRRMETDLERENRLLREQLDEERLKHKAVCAALRGDV